MRELKSQKFPMYLTYQVFMSPAFQLLTPAAKMILIQFYFEIEMSSSKQRSKKYTPTIRNRHEIVLPYAEIRARQGITEDQYIEKEFEGYTDRTINNAIRQIMAHGFLDRVKKGGSVKGDCSVYCISEAWREWQPGQKKPIHTLPVNGKVGWQKKKISYTTVQSPHYTTVQSQGVKSAL